MLRAFYVSIHETRALPEALYLLKRLDEEYQRRCGVRVGLLANWLRWRSLTGYLELAKRLGLLVLVDNGGFQGDVDPWKLASWACRHRDLFDYILLPDYPVARCLKGDRLDLECARDAATETLNAAAWFVDTCRLPAERLVPVLQGWDPESYAASYEGIAEALGAAPRYVALGSAKLWQKRSGDGERKGRLPWLLERLEELLPGVRVHLLGIHGEDLHRVYSKSIVYSADSGSQGLNYRLKWRDVLRCRAIDTDCYMKSIEYEVRLSLKPLLNKPLVAFAR